MNTLLKAIATRFGYWDLVFAAIGSAMLTRLYYQAEISTIQRGQALAIANARAHDLAALQQANLRADMLTGTLQRTEAALTHKTQEVTRALKNQTTGRTCLSAGVVRLLNDAIATDGGASVPAPAASTLAAGGAAATDTDISQWANDARAQYAVCRARLDALIDFHHP